MNKPISMIILLVSLLGFGWNGGGDDGGPIAYYGTRIDSVGFYDEFGVELPQPYIITDWFIIRVTFTDLDHNVTTLEIYLYHPPKALLAYGPTHRFDITCETDTCVWETWFGIPGSYPSGDWQMVLSLIDTFGTAAIEGVYFQIPWINWQCILPQFSSQFLACRVGTPLA